jgi:hypothetical protein
VFTDQGKRRRVTPFSAELDGLDALPDDLAAVAREVARELDEGVALQH